MSFVVVYDANVLYGNTLRDLLIRLAMTGRLQAKWTSRILDEMQRNLAADRPDIPEEKLGKCLSLLGRGVGSSDELFGSLFLAGANKLG
jgi:hypothetical protein